MEMESHKNVHRIIGKIRSDYGSHMYHAATGVLDGNPAPKMKRHKLRKAFAKFRGYPQMRMDEGTHHWSVDEDVSKNRNVIK